VSSDYKYSAFISYSHKDEKWASWLHKALETFKVPKYLHGETTSMGTIPERMQKVFRDREELASSSSLGTELTQALEDSACQIVICSPNAVASHWTNEEILTYKRLGREDRIFCLIVEGEPGSDHSECFPPALRFKMGPDGELTDEPAEPIAADARPQGDGKTNAKIKLLAGMFGVGFDALKQRELQRLKKRKAIMTTASVAAMAVISGLAYSVYLNVTYIPPVEIPPMSVLVADFDNTTGDPVFDGTLEEALQVGIEGAAFITTYDRSAALQLANEFNPGGTLDEAAARLVSTREEIGLVLAGRIEEDDSRYELVVRAIEPQEGLEVADVNATARSKDDVLAAIGELAGDLREELGDEDLDRELMETSETFTAASLEAAKSYITAQDLSDRNQSVESIDYYKKAIELDPSFGRAYVSWALSAFNLGRTEEAEELWEQAFLHLETMTERERLRTLGLYYSMITRNYPKAIETYQQLVEKYPADDAAHNNLAVLHFFTLDFAAAQAAGQRVLDIYPNVAIYHGNHALFAMYAGDFDTAVSEMQSLLETDAGYFKGWLPIAMNALANNDFESARLAYQNMAESAEDGAATASLGLADTAIFSGDFQTARDILEASVDKDVEDGSQYVAAAKYMAIADAYLAEGNLEAAGETADKILAVSNNEPWVIAAALTYLEAGLVDQAYVIADELANQLQPQSRAYGMMIKGLLASRIGRHVEAIETMTEAIALADLWLLRVSLGKAYLAADYHAEAFDEFMIAKERHGEATSLFLDDFPTYRYMVPLNYWLGVAQYGLGMRSAAAENFQAFLALRPNGGALAEDANQRLP
jgi:tetratricopeptide (TPR) repeat protein